MSLPAPRPRRRSLVARMVAPRAGEFPRETGWRWGMPTFGRTAEGAPLVTPAASLALDSVTAALRVLGESVAALPLKTYGRTAGGRGRTELWSDPTYRLLHNEPNPEQTPFVFWDTVITQCNAWGNAYLAKDVVPDRTSPSGRRVSALWIIPPETVRVRRDAQGRKVYEITDPQAGTRVWPDGDRIIHVPAIAFDGLVGLAPLALARNAVERGLSADRFAAAFYRNSAVPRGVLELDDELGDPEAERLAERWGSLYSGDNAGRVAILEGGVHFKAITMPLEDAQFVETEKLTVQKIARIFRVPASMIEGEKGGSLTYSTVEGDALHFERYSLRPWLARVEQALNRDRDLFPGDGRGAYCEFVTDAILRADAKTRGELYTMALNPETGWMARSEVRSLENLPPEDAVLRAPMAEVERQAAAALGESPRRGEDGVDLQSALDKGLALQRLGAASALYRMLSDEEAREMVGLDGPGPGPAPAPPPDPADDSANARAAAHTNGGTVHA